MLARSSALWRLPYECGDYIDQQDGDCRWHVYAMIGKLNRRVYLLSA